MSMFAKIQNGELSRKAFEKQLAQYEHDKIILQRNANLFGPEMFKSKLKGIEMSISMVELFLEKFDDIVKGPAPRHRLVK
jgi:hypothetical protein